jgi:hypothetical protein
MSGGKEPNSNLRRIKMKSSIFSALRATLVAATLVITLSATCWAREQKQTDPRLNDTTNASSNGSTQDVAEGATLQPEAVLSAQVPPPAPWCYTSNGRYPMVVALPPGVFCQVNVAFPPYVLTGVTGY